MRFKVVLQANILGSWRDTEYWAEFNAPALNRDDKIIMHSESYSSGGLIDMLLLVASSDESLLPNGGFRFAYKEVSNGES